MTIDWEKWTIPEPNSGCLIWLGATDRDYGVIVRRKRPKKYVHRLAYEFHVGPIPDKLQIDHLCCNKTCCNPAHLEIVTLGENTRRYFRSITHCKRGHELSGDNLVHNRKTRYCRTCRNQLQKERKKRLRWLP